MAQGPLFLSPASPSELLSYIIDKESYPTTLIICAPKAEFIASLIYDVQPPQELEPEDLGSEDAGPTDDHTPAQPQPAEAARQLLHAPLFQVAVARHIRMVFAPTVSHLRAFLSVFSPGDAKVTAPPPPQTDDTHGEAPREPGRRPLLLVYAFLELHRHTSEWSAQGLGHTAAGLVEAAALHSFWAVIVEARTEEFATSEAVLGEQVPLLSGATLRMGHDLDDGGWSGRTVEAKRVLARWFRFEDKHWAENTVQAADNV